MRATLKISFLWHFLKKKTKNKNFFQMQSEMKRFQNITEIF